MEYLAAAGFILAILVGGIALLVHTSKAEAVAEDDLEEEKEANKQTAELAKEANDATKLREDTKRNTLAGIRPDSLRKYDR